jgi:hypothetical protein
MNFKKTIRSAFENYQAGNLQQAELICKKIILNEPDNVEVLNFIGVINYQEKNMILQ